MTLGNRTCLKEQKQCYLKLGDKAISPIAS